LRHFLIMGAVNSIELNVDNQVKLFRQLQNEHERLTAGQLDCAQMYQSLKQKYDNLATLYGTNSFNCPKVRFGRTEIQMPILSCGGMRMQETWQPKGGMTLEMINKECQKNLEDIVDRSMKVSLLSYFPLFNIL
jgi:hypothetical protein